VDIFKAIRELHEEKDRLDKIIARLEQLKAAEEVRKTLPILSRRGRKHMPEDERKIVSERMRNYWAKRRAARKAAAASSPEPAE